MLRFGGTADATLADLIGIRPGDVIAAVGGGGKTAALEALASDLAARQSAVIMTTTTKIWPRAGATTLVADGTWPPEAAAGEIVTAASEVGADGKLHGLTPETVCSIRSDHRVILCEADGSAGRSLKVHGPGEPVVPECTTSLLCVAGLDVLDRPIDDTTVHRLAHLDSIGQELPERVSPAVVVAVLRSGARHVPEGSRVIFVLNKALGQPRAVRDVAERLAGAGDLVISTERGVPIGGGVFELR